MSTEALGTVLIVEDEEGTAELQRRRLERAGFTVRTAATAEGALAALRAGGIDLAVLDFQLPGGVTGLDVFAQMKAAGLNVPVILVTGFSDEAKAIQALRAGVRDFVTKSAGYLNYLPEAARRVFEGVQLERRLAESEARLASVIASAKDAIIVTGPDRRIALFNPAAEQMFRCPAAAAVGQWLGRFIPPEYPDPLPGSDNGASPSALARDGCWGVRADGERFPLEASVARAEFGGQRLHTVVVRDVTERWRAEERIREQAALLDQARDAILVKDLHGTILYWNRSATRLYGWPAAEALSRHTEELLHHPGDPDLAEPRRAVLGRGEWAGELHQVARDGTELVVESRWTLVRDGEGRPKSTLVVNTDVTEKKRLEGRLLRAQRLESIGTLAGGIAHDLNNVLTPIMMAIEFLRMPLAEEQRQSVLTTLQASAERGAEMVRQVLTFARGAEGRHAPTDLRRVARDLETMLRQTFPRSLDVRVEVAGDLAPVVGDATQLYQVLMNLCVNARDAMLGGGTLTVAAGNVAGGEAPAHPGAAPGPYVRLRVADTGTGIPATVLDKIFDPFFTTKEIGKGTGLGLATVLGIVEGHGGFIDVASEVGRGTRFDVYLPATLVPAAPDAAAAPAGPAGRGELILVVDDEVGIRNVARMMLEAHGYRVVTAANGKEALAAYAERPGEVRAVLTDMMMPVMDGPATIRALRELDPALPVLAFSGLADTFRADDPALAGVRAIVRKPLSGADLLATLAGVLQ